MKLKDEIIFEQIEDEGFLYDTEKDKLFSLNDVGRFIVDLIAKKKSKDDVLKKLTSEYDVSIEQAEKDLDEFLDELNKQGFLEQ